VFSGEQENSGMAEDGLIIASLAGLAAFAELGRVLINRD
jgi:hypothetical protein